MNTTLVTVTVSEGSTLDAKMDPSIGRARRFLVVDLETGRVVEALDNPAANAAHGAGIQAATAVSRLGVSAVLTGRFGPKAAAGLRSLGLAMYEVPGTPTAGEAVEAFRQGRLDPK